MVVPIAYIKRASMHYALLNRAHYYITQSKYSLDDIISTSTSLSVKILIQNVATRHNQNIPPKYTELKSSVLAIKMFKVGVAYHSMEAVHSHHELQCFSLGHMGYHSPGS